MAIVHDIGGPQRGAVAANAICLAAMVTWAMGFPAAERLLANWDPLFLSTARILLAVAVLLPAWIAIDGPQAVLGARWGRGMGVGAIGFGAGAYLLLLAQSLTDPVTVSIVAATMPAVGAVLEIVLDGRRRGAKFASGVALTVAGAAVATGIGGGEGQVVLGAGIALASVVVYTWASRASVVELPELSRLGQTTLTLAGAALFSAVVALGMWALFDAQPLRGPVDGAQLADLAVYAVAAMALSQLLWLTGVGRLGVGVASLHVNAAPFYVMILVVAAGGDWHLRQLVGACLVGAGIFIAQMPRRR